jgi:hypothetical protein
VNARHPGISLTHFCKIHIDLLFNKPSPYAHPRAEPERQECVRMTAFEIFVVLEPAFRIEMQWVFEEPVGCCDVGCGHDNHRLKSTET